MTAFDCTFNNKVYLIFFCVAFFFDILEKYVLLGARNLMIQILVLLMLGTKLTHTHIYIYIYIEFNIILIQLRLGGEVCSIVGLTVILQLILSLSEPLILLLGKMGSKVIY